MYLRPQLKHGLLWIVLFGLLCGCVTKKRSGGKPDASDVHRLDLSILVDGHELDRPSSYRCELHRRVLALDVRAKLEAQRIWGQVWISPISRNDAPVSDVALVLSCRIVRSGRIVIDATWEGASGDVWGRERYSVKEDEAQAALTGESVNGSETIAWRIAEKTRLLRDSRSSSQLEMEHTLRKLRHAALVLPSIFGNYISPIPGSGAWRVVRLPAHEDASWMRLQQLQMREGMLLDAITRHALDQEGALREGLGRVTKAEQGVRDRIAELRRHEWKGPFRTIGGGLTSGLGVFVAAFASMAGSDEEAGAAAVSRSLDERGDELALGHDRALRDAWAALAAVREMTEAEMGATLIELDGHIVRLEGNARKQWDSLRAIIQRMAEEEQGFYDYEFRE